MNQCDGGQPTVTAPAAARVSGHPCSSVSCIFPAFLIPEQELAKMRTVLEIRALPPVLGECAKLPGESLHSRARALQAPGDRLEFALILGRHIVLNMEAAAGRVQGTAGLGTQSKTRRLVNWQRWVPHFRSSRSVGVIRANEIGHANASRTRWIRGLVWSCDPCRRRMLAARKRSRQGTEIELKSSKAAPLNL